MMISLLSSLLLVVVLLCLIVVLLSGLRLCSVGEGVEA